MSFSFGTNNNSTPNKPLFGAAATPATSNLFGGANNTANSGSSTPAAAPTLFGSGAKSSGSTLFGGSSTPAASGSGLFGNAQSTPGASQPASSGFAFGKTGGDAGAAKPSLFGGAGAAGAAGAAGSSGASTGGTSFAFGQPAASSTPTATPAPNKTFGLPSTTPAGPPPGTSLFGQAGSGATSTPGLFGGAASKPTSTSSLFGNAASSSTPAQPASNAFAGFGKKDDTNKSAPAQASALAGNAAPQATAQSSLFSLGSTTPAATPANKPAFGFGQPASSQPSASSTPAFSLGGNKTPSLSLGGDKSAPASTGTTPSTMSAFGTKPATTQSSGNSLLSRMTPAEPSAGSTPSTPAASGGSSLFGAQKPAASDGATTGATPSATSGFSLFNKPSSATPASGASSGATPSAAPATPATPGFSLNKPSSATPASGGPSTATTAAATTGTASASLFSKPAAPTAASSSTPAPAATATTGTAPAASGDASKTGFATSTAGPAPSAQSRLKNKSMDEIITRWASDLSKYQKEFQAQANTVAKWDRALVENSDKVKQLYSKTFQAERDAQEVEKHLTHIEDNQAELDHFLDKYEKEIDQMMQIHGVGGRAESLRGPDQERERTYKLAEKLQDRLNELNKDLTEMIEEINATSQTLSKSAKPDDPLTKVVRVLNSQLAQLQLIDSGAAQLQQKIERAQKEGQRVGGNGWSGLGSDPTEDFYRSFRGSRTERYGGVA